MTDNSITEAYFVARGFRKMHIDSAMWKLPNGTAFGLELPNILTSYPDFKEHVLEVMGEDGWVLEIENEWVWWKLPDRPTMPQLTHEIKSNNILHAAVIAATRYFEEKK